MSNAIYKKDLRDVALAVAQGSKNYTDKTKEEIYWHIGDYSISTQPDNTTASTKTVPTGATRCKIKKIYGLTEKFNPSVAYDNASTMTKTMPNVVYDFDCSVVYGNSEVSENDLYDYTQLVNGGIDGASVTTYTADEHSITITDRGAYPYDRVAFVFNTTVGNKYTVSLNASTNSRVGIIDNNKNVNVLEDNFSGDKVITFTAATTTTYVYFYAYYSVPTSFTNIHIVEGETPYFDDIHNLELSGLVVKNSDDEVMQTLPIDLSTILYNGSPLFEGNSLKAVNDVKDILTPYKATKKVGYVDLGTLTWQSYNDDRKIYVANLSDIKQVAQSETPKMITANYNTVDWFSTTIVSGMISLIENSIRIIICDTRYITVADFQTAMSGVYLVYELATPIEVSIDWSSTLRGITGYSNGTITLQNTHNMDTANTITYNSIIKENCCAKIVQSRGGSVVKTINLPTTASDGYSAGSVNNVRDFTTNKRYTNVNKGDLGSYGYEYNETTKKFLTFISNLKINTLNAISSLYSVMNNGYGSQTIPDMTISIHNAANSIMVRNDNFITAQAFKQGNNGVPFYYELADASKTETSIDSVDNIIEVQPDDVLSFYDSNDNLVTVPSDITYRIEVERV